MVSAADLLSKGGSAWQKAGMAKQRELFCDCT